ncbi:hypothetical protein [Flavobacterium macrobrachii]|jgi:hypothetical protein|uniref:hypothetical protein n=1 Tax=Flavobacterium macrobrachii TaxID=591204 RepID=UPI0037C14971
MGKLLTESVEEYLDLFDSKDNFITKNAFKAMLHNYMEVKMVDFYLNSSPNELFILSYDDLSISLKTESLNYLQINFQRSFSFDNIDDQIQIRLELHFENIIDDTKYFKYFKLSLNDNDDVFENNIKLIKKDFFYKQAKNLKPTKYYLYEYYDI